jgi:hypothetical protein
MMIVVGQFFLMNLILAVIIFSFIRTQREELNFELDEINDPDATAKIGEGEE